MGGKAGPGIDSNTPSGHNIVNKMTITRSKIEDACGRWHTVSEKGTPKVSPEYVAARIGSEAGFVIIYLHVARFQPKVIPRIMRKPTLRARRLSVFPPLLTP